MRIRIWNWGLVEMRRTSLSDNCGAVMISETCNNFSKISMVLLFSIQLAKINGNTRESTRKDPLEPSYLDFADLVLNIQARFLLSLMRVLLYSACNSTLECVQ